MNTTRRRRSVPSYPIRARLWRLRIAGLAETNRLREVWTLSMVEG